MADGMAKNWEVVKAEIAAYKDIVKIQWERVKAAPWKRKLHVLSGLEPDAHRTLPRTLSYANRILWALSGLAGAIVAGWILFV